MHSTFSHQELALAAIMGSIYYLFRDRISLASLKFGLATNIHALYSFFPMFL